MRSREEYRTNREWLASRSLHRLMVSHRGGSQRARMVRFLAYYPGWHSITDIHREVGFCRLNSRVAEARKVFRRDGHPFDIVHSIRDGEHGYELVQLTSNPLEGGAASADAPMVASPSSGYELVPLEAGACADPSRGAGAPASSGANLVSQADPDSHDEDGPLVLEGQRQLL